MACVCVYVCVCAQMTHYTFNAVPFIDSPVSVSGNTGSSMYNDTSMTATLLYSINIALILLRCAVL